MASTFHGSIDGHSVVAAPHCGPGGTMNFAFGSTAVDERTYPKEPLFTVPFSQDPDFVDRPDILAWIHEKCAAPASRAALVGLGGIGKSQLAIQYCHSVRLSSPQTWVFWVHASTAARFEQAYRDIADRLALPGRNDPNTDTLRLVRNWLCDKSNNRWTMVIDNADDIEVFYSTRNSKQGDVQDTSKSLAAYLPQSHNGSILITSRSSDAAARLAGSHKAIKKVDAMNKSQALQLLQNKLEGASDEASMVALLQQLDYIPLAISQAAAYINRCAPRMTVPRYLDHFRSNDKAMTSLLNRDTGDLRRDESASNSVVATWQISFEQILKERPSAANLLSIMSFFNPQGIPEEVLRNFSTNEGTWKREKFDSYLHNQHSDQEDPDNHLNENLIQKNVNNSFDEDLYILRAFSLVAINSDNDACNMHHLVQFCTKVWLSSVDDLERWRQKFVTLMADEFPYGNFEGLAKRQALFPHIEPLLAYEPWEREAIREWAALLTKVAWYMEETGNYKMGESLGTKAVETRETILGEEHPLTLVSLENLASSLHSQRKLKTAENMTWRVFIGYKKVLGIDHPNTISSLQRLATMLHEQGKSQDAEDMISRVLARCEEIFGKEHPQTLGSMDRLALVLQSQGKYQAAEEVSRRALAGYEKTLRKDDPRMLYSLGQLAETLKIQGKFKTAEEMYRQVLEGFEHTFGKEHPHTLNSLDNLASALGKQGRYEEAVQMLRRAQEGWERTMGKEHEYTFNNLDRLAIVLAEQGAYEAAEETHRRALEGFLNLLGPQHPITLGSSVNLALLLKKQGNVIAAEEMYRQTLDASQKTQGEFHRVTILTLSNLRILLAEQGKFEEAEELCRREVEGHKKTLGEEHHATLTTLYRLAELLCPQGKYEAAEEIYRQALEGCKRSLGEAHPETLQGFDRLAMVLLNQGKHEAAESTIRPALVLLEKLYGKEHPSTLWSLSGLAKILQEQGRYEAASIEYRKAIDRYQRTIGTDHPNAVWCQEGYEAVKLKLQHSE